MGEFFVFLIFLVILYILYKEFVKEGGFPSLLCAFGYHKYENWDYISNQGCEKQQACSVCGKLNLNSEIIIVHNWAITYLKENSCEKLEICSRCREIKSEIFVEHTWIESFLGENTNKKQKECSRCGYHDAIQTSQNLWPWIFENGDKRKYFLQLQIALQQTSLSSDIFLIKNNSRDEQIRTISEVLPETNLKVYGFKVGKMIFIVYPDGIHIFRDGDFLSITQFEELTVEFGKIRVRCSDIPNDGVVIEHTWQYSRMNGKRDFRFKDNKVISIVEYAHFTLGTPKNGEYQAAISSNAKAINLLNAFNSYIFSYIGKKQRNEYAHQASNSQSQQNSQYRTNDSQNSKESEYGTRNESPKELTLESARKVLGINAGASQEEVRKAYLELVQKYHPDKVFNLADEYKSIAESRMKEINAAYLLIKNTFSGK